MRKAIGGALLVAGIGAAIAAMNMDTTVEVGGSPERIVGTTYGTETIPAVSSVEVHNVGLMARQRNWLIIGVAMGLAGLLTLLIGKDTLPPSASESESPQQDQMPPEELAARLGVKMVGSKFVAPDGREFGTVEAAVLYAQSR